MSTEAEAAKLLNTPPQPAKRKRGRPPLPRDEHGNIIRDGNKTPPKKRVVAEDSDDDNDDESPPQKTFTYEKTDAGVQGSAFLMRTIWGMLGPFIKCGPLSDEQAITLGEAADPMLQKYIPVLADWQIEMNFVVAIYSVYEATKIREEAPKSDSTAEVVDEV